MPKGPGKVGDGEESPRGTISKGAGQIQRGAVHPPPCSPVAMGLMAIQKAIKNSETTEEL